jgi:putative CocE/NonD family hydrolase
MVVAPGIGTERGVRGRLADGFAGRLLGLPPATTDYTVTSVRIPTRDGVELAADLYRPTAPPVGTLLARSPYGRGPAYAVMAVRPYAARGYQVLFVSSRGTFGSGGTFVPARTEAEDGQEVVAWMREQEWFTGTFATVGASYPGYAQWALLSDPPPELVAAVVTMGPHDFSLHHWGTGAFNLGMLAWSDLIAHQEDGGGLMRRLTAPRRLRPVLDGLPLADVAEAHFQGAAPWYRDIVTHPDVTDPYWVPVQHGAALDRVSVPVLLLGGWQDIFLEQTIEQYTRLHERGVDVALTVGPWTHRDMAGKAARRLAREGLDWLDEHLARRTARARTAPVQVHVGGAAEWREFPVWPPVTDTRTLYLHGGRKLSPRTPPEQATPTSFRFDPARPTPTVSGPIMSGGGYREDSKLAMRPDVVAFTGDLLTEDREVLGAPQVVLHHVSDNPHADLFVRLSDVAPNGRSRNVTEGYLRLDPTRADGPITLRMRDTAYRFRVGHRLRLIIAGGSHPHYARNLGTGENPGTGSTLAPTRHTIHHDRVRASHLILPG